MKTVVIIAKTAKDWNSTEFLAHLEADGCGFLKYEKVTVYKARKREKIHGRDGKAKPD